MIWRRRVVGVSHGNDSGMNTSTPIVSPAHHPNQFAGAAVRAMRCAPQTARVPVVGLIRQATGPVSARNFKMSRGAVNGLGYPTHRRTSVTATNACAAAPAPTRLAMRRVCAFQVGKP